MVQIVSRAPGIGETLGAGLGAGIGAGLTEKLAQHQKEKRLQSGLAKLDALGDVEAMDFNALQKEIFGAFPGDPDLAQTMIGNLLQSQLMKAKAQPTSEQLAKQEAKAQGLRAIEQQAGLQAGELGDMDLATARALYAPTQMFEKTGEKLSAESSHKVAEEIRSGFKGYQRDKLISARMRELNEGGKLTRPLTASLLEKLDIPLSVVGNPASEEYAKLVQNKMKGITDTYGGRILAVEVDNYLKSIPTLMNSTEGRRRILRNEEIMNLPKKLEYDAMTQILKESGGKIPPNLADRVAEIVDPQVEALAQEFKDNISAPIPQNDIPERQKVPQGTKIDKDIALGYLRRAGGDMKKAERMAKQDGYDF